MPTYIYKRDDGELFEYYQSITEPALETCPETGLPVKRLIIGGNIAVPASMNTRSVSTEHMKKNPHHTTLSHYQKKIDANTQKAREAKAKLGLI